MMKAKRYRNLPCNGCEKAERLAYNLGRKDYKMAVCPDHYGQTRYVEESTGIRLGFAYRELATQEPLLVYTSAMPAHEQGW
jgi:hypothetical protein